MRIPRPKPSTLLPFLGVLLATAGCDHVAKQVAVSSLDAPQELSLAGATLHLEVTTNPGAFLSLGASLPQEVRTVLFLVLVPAVLVWLCARLLAGSHVSRGVVLGLGLLLHGGAATDFMLLELGQLHTGIFNLADAAVVAGSGILLLSAWRAGGEIKGSPTDG